jgi:hypothetical protein
MRYKEKNRKSFNEGFVIRGNKFTPEFLKNVSKDVVDKLKTDGGIQSSIIIAQALENTSNIKEYVWLLAGLKHSGDIKTYIKENFARPTFDIKEVKPDLKVLKGMDIDNVMGYYNALDELIFDRNKDPYKKLKETIKNDTFSSTWKDLDGEDIVEEELIKLLTITEAIENKDIVIEYIGDDEDDIETFEESDEFKKMNKPDTWDYYRDEDGEFHMFGTSKKYAKILGL